MASPVDTRGFSNPYDYYKTAAQNVMPSPESLDRSAARLRNRNDTEYNANSQRITDQYAGKGRANSGAADYAQTMNNYGRQQSYSTGYADLLDGYEKNRMQGAVNLGNIGQQYGNTLKDEQGLNIADRGNEIATQQANTGQYNAETTRSTETAKAINDFMTFMGTFGNTNGNDEFNRMFGGSKTAFMNLLGIPMGPSPNQSGTGSDSGGTGGTGGVGGSSGFSSPRPR